MRIDNDFPKINESIRILPELETALKSVWIHKDFSKSLTANILKLETSLKSVWIHKGVPDIRNCIKISMI